MEVLTSQQPETRSSVKTLETVKVAVIGAGIRGKMFADVLAGIPNTVLVGFVDPALPRDAGIEVRGQHVAHWPTTDEMWEDATPNAVIVATPDFLHADVVVDMAKRGVAIMLEKPVATTQEDTERIKEAVANSGVYCMVAFENRWNPPFTKIRAQIESGATGKPVFQAARLSNTYFVPTKMLSWAAKSSPLWFLFPHTIDLVQWLAGAEVTKVSALGTRGLLTARGVDTWDVVHVLATLSDGSTANLTSAWVLPEGHPAPVDFTYEFVGESQSAFTDVGRSGLQMFGDRHSTVGVSDGVFDGENSSAPAWMARRFVRDLHEGRDPETPLSTGLQVNQVLFAIERSLESGEPQTV
jgi:predicted dehydrogenase